MHASHAHTESNIGEGACEGIVGGRQCTRHLQVGNMQDAAPTCGWQCTTGGNADSYVHCSPALEEGLRDPWKEVKGSKLVDDIKSDGWVIDSDEC